MIKLRSIPTYYWTLIALILGIMLGGIFTETFRPAANGTTSVIKFIVKLVPVLIFAALSPAFASLVKRGLAGKFAFSVVTWFVFSSSLAGIIGVIISSLLFGIPFASESGGAWIESFRMFRIFGEEGGASVPLLAILFAVFTGVIAVWISPLFRLLKKIEDGIGLMGQALGYVLIPVLFCLGLTIGVNFGPKLGMEHFFLAIIYTVILCAGWSAFYILVVIKIVCKRPLKKVLTKYYFPTVIVALGTISSLVTLPVNLVNSKKYGIRKEIADFVIPFGAVVNMNGSALMNIALIPFVLTYIFGIEVSWVSLLIAWPAIVLFTIAAPGLPAGMGSALWTSMLFSSMLGLEEPVKSTFITTFVAFYGGVPDMFVTAVNCTGDGFSAILFDSKFSRLFKPTVTDK